MRIEGKDWLTIHDKKGSIVKINEGTKFNCFLRDFVKPKSWKIKIGRASCRERV